jgi:hypothetical protein
VRGRLGAELPVQLHRTAPSATRIDETVVLTTYPRTDFAGSTMSQTGGRFDAPHLGQLVSGLQAGPRSRPRATDTSSAIRGGDVLVIEQVDATIDTAAGRPALAVDGSARVVMIKPNGRVVTDRSVLDDEVIVPPGVRMIAVHAAAASGDPASVAGGGGVPLAGWHVRSRLARLGVRSALGAGCVVCSDAPAPDRRTGWVTGDELVSEATTVTTSFPTSAEFVVVVLDGVAPADLDPLSITFAGCRRAVDGAGQTRRPTVVQAGSQSLVFVGIAMDAGVTGFTVTARAGGGWRIGGALAGRGAVGDVAAHAAEVGVDAIAARLLAGTGSGPGCQLEWRTPIRTRRMPDVPEGGR